MTKLKVQSAFSHPRKRNKIHFSGLITLFYFLGLPLIDIKNPIRQLPHLRKTVLGIKDY